MANPSGPGEHGSRSDESEHKYRMTLSLNVLNHLGIGLYSNVPAVVSELVANAWDADAATVHITLSDGRIEVQDTGHGMTLQDINERFLKVGYQRRLASSKTSGGREAMGRKGIGKLSSFSIANIVEVHTVKDGEANALSMNRQKIEEEIKEDASSEYHPEEIEADVGGLGKGTRLVLRQLDRSISRTPPFLRRRLARRFSIIGPAHGFEVFVDGTPISASDRDFYNKLEFLWHFGQLTDPEVAGTIKERHELDATVVVPTETSATEEPGQPPAEPQTYPISGWIGTVDRPDSLDDVNNSIILLARGKLVHENILPEFKEAGMYAQYVVGEVNADFLDEGPRDIVTSNRQSVKEDDPRYRAVNDFVRKALKTIKNQWTDLRKREATTRALTYPSVQRWYDRLGTDSRKTAERLFGRIESLTLPDNQTRLELYRATILAFEKLALQDMLSALDGIETQRDFETLSRLIVGVEEIEAVHYHEVARGRLKVIEQLKDLAPTALERVLQQLLFEELWLLHPSWERAAANARIEERVTTEFEAVSVKLSEEERKGRIDIRYKTAAGRHVIVELKKYGRTVTAPNLIEQLRKYKTALEKCLSQRFPDESRDIEMIAILGSPPPGDDGENRRMLAAVNARYITYDQLVRDAERSYAEYLRRDEEVSKLVEIIKGLDEDFERQGQPST